MHVSEDDKESVWCMDQGMYEGVRADAQVWRPEDSIVCPAWSLSALFLGTGSASQLGSSKTQWSSCLQRVHGHTQSFMWVLEF